MFPTRKEPADWLLKVNRYEEVLDGSPNRKE